VGVSCVQSTIKGEMYKNCKMILYSKNISTLWYELRNYNSIGIIFLLHYNITTMRVQQLFGTQTFLLPWVRII